MIDLINLAANMDEDELRAISRTVMSGYEMDEDSRGEWLEKHKKYLQLYYQTDEPINQPWQGSSTESMPLMAEAVNQYTARSTKAMFPGRRFVDAIPIGQKDEAAIDRAKRVGHHMNFQLMQRPLKGHTKSKYRKHKKQLIQSVALHGTCFTKTFPAFNPYMPVVRNVRAQDLVIPYGVGPRDLEDIERKTEIVHMTVQKSEFLANQNHGGTPYFLKPISPYTRNDMDEGPTEAHDEAHGLEEPGFSRGAKPGMLYEQHCLLDLDGDGLAEPYIVTLDAQTKDVLRIAPRYVTIGGEQIPIEYYTQYNFLENPDGAYGLGMGHLIGFLNSAVNKLVRQSVDAGELATVGNMSGFINDQMAIRGGEIEFKLGLFEKVSVTGTGRLQDQIWSPQFPGPHPVLGEVIAALTNRSDRLATTTEAVTGQTEKVMQPTTILALIEQALEIFTDFSASLLESAEDELAKVYRLNGWYLGDEEYFAVLDDDMEPRALTVARQDYTEDLQIRPVADPNQVTQQQKIASAQAVRDIIINDPLTALEPTRAHLPTRELLRVLGTRNLDEMYPPYEPSAPQRVDDPLLENASALLPKPEMPPVHMDQDHQTHLEAHEAMMADDVYSKRLTPDGRQQLHDHIQMHLYFIYLLTETDALETISGETGEGRNPELAPPPGGAVVPLGT